MAKLKITAKQQKTKRNFTRALIALVVLEAIVIGVLLYGYGN